MREFRKTSPHTPATLGSGGAGCGLWLGPGRSLKPLQSRSPQRAVEWRQVLLSASRFSVVHLSSHLPSLQAKGVSSQKECFVDRSGYDLWFKDSTFQQSRTHTHTHTPHPHTPPRAKLVFVARSLCAFAWSCYIFRERHVYTNPGRRGPGRGEEGGKEELARKRPEKEKESTAADRQVSSTPFASIGI